MLKKGEEALKCVGKGSWIQWLILKIPYPKFDNKIENNKIYKRETF